MSHKSVLELNGKQYDAASGKVIATKTSTSPKRTVGTNMDGFTRVIHPSKPTTKAPKPVAQSVPTKKPAPNRSAAQPHKRAPQPTKTLMRHVVKKPRKSSTAATVSGISAPVDVSITPASHRSKPEARITSTLKVQKSPLISRFGSPVGTGKSSIQKRTAPVPVVPVPAHAEPRQEEPASPATKRPIAPKKHDHIATALEKADSHTKHKTAKVKRRHKAAHKLGVSSRFVSTAAASLAILLLVGFFAYQNVPNIAVRMASSKAGFSAKLPSYQPSGFAVSGPVQASPGIITINFKSNSDERAYQLSQRPSEWNSESLLNNFVATRNQPYQTFQEAGKIVYLYDDSATWVSGGVWYQIEGDADLNSDQLLRIASSL